MIETCLLKSLSLTMAAAAAGVACTVFPTPVRYDTLSPGVVVVTHASQADSSQRDTVVISRYAEMKAHVEALLAESGLVFIGRIDSTITIPPDSDSVPALSPDPIDLSTEWDTASFASELYLHLRIDTVMQGTLPGKSFWVHARQNITTCDNIHPTGKSFLNASNGMTRLSDIKVRLEPSGYSPPPPSAHWFDGRYLTSPDHPGLRLDITELYPDYPATSIRSPRSPRSPGDGAGSWGGRAYLPNGRQVPNAPDGQKIPVPVFR